MTGPADPIVAAEAPPATTSAEPVSEEPQHEQEPARGTIAEWTITVLLLLFLTTTLVQAFVIPTGSMEDTLLVGDHLLVDKLAYAPSGPVSKYLLPYRQVKRGDIIVFRYPVDISQTFVKRCMGVPGDHIRLVNKQVYLNGVKRWTSRTKFTRPITSIPIATISRVSRMSNRVSGRDRHAAAQRGERRSGGAATAIISRWAIIAINRSTAATGDSCRAKTLSASR